MIPALFKYTFLLLIVLLVPRLKGQSTYDSIRSILPNHPDSAYNLAFQLNSNLIEGTPDSIVGKSLYLLGLATYYKSEYYLAEDFFLKAIEKFNTNESSLFLEACYNNIGICREMSGRLDESIESYLKSRSIAEDRKDSMGMMQTNINIGLLNLKINRINEGKEILKDAERFFELKMDSVNLALIYQNLVKAADLEGDIQSFIDFSNQALFIYKNYDYQPGVCEILNNLGNAYIKVGNYPVAKEKLAEGLQIALTNGLKNSEGFILSNFGKLAFRQNKWGAAEGFYNDSKLIFEELGNTAALQEVLWDFLGVYFQSNRFMKLKRKIN